MQPPDYNINESLGFITGKTHRSLHGSLTRKLADLGTGLTTEHGIVMMHLVHNDGMNQQELCNCTFKEKTSMARLLDTMEKKGFVVRTPDRDDRRQKRIYLTRQGRELIPTFYQMAQEMLSEALQGIDAAELETCKRVLRQVYFNMEGQQLVFPGTNE